MKNTVPIESDKISTISNNPTQMGIADTILIDKHKSHNPSRQNKTKRLTKKGDPNIEELKQQIEHSSSVIKSLELKVNNLEQTNFLLRQNLQNNEILSNQEEGRNSATILDNETQHVHLSIEKKLEKMELNNRISQIEQTQQLIQLQIQQQQMATSIYLAQQQQQLMQISNMTYYQKVVPTPLSHFGVPMNFTHIPPPPPPPMGFVPRMNLNQTSNLQINTAVPNYQTVSDSVPNTMEQNTIKCYGTKTAPKDRFDSTEQTSQTIERQTLSQNCAKNDKECYIVESTIPATVLEKHVTGHPLIMRKKQDIPRMHSTPRRVSFDTNNKQDLNCDIKQPRNVNAVEKAARHTLSPKHFLSVGRATTRTDRIPPQCLNKSQ